MAFRELVLPRRCSVPVLREADGGELVVKRHPLPTKCVQDVNMNEMVVMSTRMNYRSIETNGSRVAVIVTGSEPPCESPSPPCTSLVSSFTTLWKLLLLIFALYIAVFVVADILQYPSVTIPAAPSNRNAKHLPLQITNRHKGRCYPDSLWSTELLATLDRFPRSICPNERNLLRKCARRMCQTPIQQSTSPTNQIPFKQISYITAVPPTTSLNELPNEPLGLHLPLFTHTLETTSNCPVPEQQRGTTDHYIAEVCAAVEKKQTTRPTLKCSLPRSSLWAPRTRRVLDLALTNVGSLTHSIAEDIGPKKITSST